MNHIEFMFRKGMFLIINYDIERGVVFVPGLTCRKHGARTDSMQFSIAAILFGACKIRRLRRA